MKFLHSSLYMTLLRRSAAYTIHTSFLLTSAQGYPACRVLTNNLYPVHKPIVGLPTHRVLLAHLHKSLSLAIARGHRVHPFLMVRADLSGPVSPRSTHRIGRRGQQRHAVRVDPQRLDCLRRQTLT